MVLGRAVRVAFPDIDPIGKTVRIGLNEFTVIGVLGKRPSPGWGSTEVDDFAVIPYVAHEKFYGKVLRGSAVSPGTASRRRVPLGDDRGRATRRARRDAAMGEVEALVRTRHRLSSTRPNDFDHGTQDAVLQVWDQFSPGHVSRSLVISRSR